MPTVTVTLQYDKDLVAANAKLFLFTGTLGSLTQVDDGTWTTGVGGSKSITGLTSGQTYWAVFVDPLKAKNTRVFRFVASATTFLTNAILNTTPQSGASVVLDFEEATTIYSCDSPTSIDGNISIFIVPTTVLWPNVPGRVEGAYFGLTSEAVNASFSAATNNVRSTLPTIFLDDPSINP